MKIYFFYQTKNGKAGRVYVERKPLVFGRKGSQNNLDDAECSRRHCMIKFENNELILEDLDSKNGTIVNGVKTTNCRIFIGDVIKIGNTKIILDQESLSEDLKQLFTYNGDKSKRQVGDVTLQLDNNQISKSTADKNIIEAQGQNKLYDITKKR